MHNMRDITQDEEETIRKACQAQYSEEGKVQNPYEWGTIQFLTWGDAALDANKERIKKLEAQL